MSKKLAKTKTNPSDKLALRRPKGRKRRMVRAVEGQISSGAYGAVFGAFGAERQECVMG